MVAADQRRNLPGPTQHGVRLDRVWVEDGDLRRQYRADHRTIAELLKDPDRNAATHDLLKARLIQEVKNDDTLLDIVMGGHTIWHTYVDSSGEYLIDLGCRRDNLQAY
jgi:predicted YcjX-like family ATPase